MIPNKVDAEVLKQDTAAVMAALETIRKKLPFLVALAPDERKRLSKLGRKSQTFTHQALDVATQHPELMPGCLDVAKAQRDIGLFVALNPILNAVSELQTQLKDTQMLAGSEAYAAARMAYSSAKTIGKGMGMDDVVGNLSMRFEQKPSSSPAPAEAPAEAAS